MIVFIKNDIQLILTMREKRSAPLLGWVDLIFNLLGYILAPFVPCQISVRQFSLFKMFTYRVMDVNTNSRTLVCFALNKKMKISLYTITVLIRNCSVYCLKYRLITFQIWSF